MWLDYTLDESALALAAPLIRGSHAWKSFLKLSEVDPLRWFCCDHEADRQASPWQFGQIRGPHVCLAVNPLRYFLIPGSCSQTL